jgi:hypothetical protein
MKKRKSGRPDGTVTEPILREADMDVAFREGAMDEEIEGTLRDPLFWSYIVRDPTGRVMACGRGTRAECETEAINSAEQVGVEMWIVGNWRWRGDWRFRIWPPK